ncbi:unnamed protein product (mitochondrion) [Plasmodiophora brassicae]|nr:unnamed protein product [Plasmodiophora brassicae]
MKICTARPSLPVPPIGITSPTDTSDPRDVLLVFIRTALTNKLQGNGLAFNKICESLSGKLDSGAIVRWYSTLNNCVSLIVPGPAHAQLVQTVFAFDAWDVSPESTESYAQFIVDLVSCNGKFLPMCFGALVEKLRCHTTSCDVSVTSPYALPGRTPESVLAVCEGVSSLICRILQLIPSALTSLFPLIVQSFPHPRMSADEHLAFIGNILRLSQDAPELRDRIVQLIVQKVVLLDCESNEDHSAVDDKPAGPALDRLDRILALLLEHLQSVQNSRPDLCGSLFASLMHVFESTVLTSCNCRHVPFLMFYMCSFRNSFAETFLSFLLERALDLTQPQQVRVSCSRYLRGFLMTANYVRHASRMHCFEVILKYIHSYIEVHEDDLDEMRIVNDDTIGDGNGKGLHAVFYSLCETMLKLFCCFKPELQELLEEAPDLAEFFRFSSIVESSLNPLRFCCPDTVAEFATILISMGLGDCYPVIRRNNMLASVAHPAVSTTPFTVLRLPLSRAFFSDIHHESWHSLG